MDDKLFWASNLISIIGALSVLGVLGVLWCTANEERARIAAIIVMGSAGAVWLWATIVAIGYAVR